MDSMQDFIPFARELLSQRPSRGLLKVYLLGSVLAALGTLVALVEAACQPFSSDLNMDADMILVFPRDQRTVQRQSAAEEEEEGLDGVTTQKSLFSKTSGRSQRSLANRLHAS
ncbi:G0/G1 switch protein 2 [Genypterus blacodes]|uniref:G0/G1 switch protein 2 n=1 Tax=Genypterus blacodes TaxID=154954 RepID=UPI003F776735